MVRVEMVVNVDLAGLAVAPADQIAAAIDALGRLVRVVGEIGGVLEVLVTDDQLEPSDTGTAENGHVGVH